MERRVIQGWYGELKEIFGKNSMEKLTLFFDFLEMLKKNEKGKEKDVQICSQILEAMEELESGRIGEKECMQKILLTEQYLGILCSYVDASCYAQIGQSSQRFAELIRWVGDYQLNDDGRLGLNCQKAEDSEKYPVPKRYWALAYWARNTDAHDMVVVNKKWSVQIMYAVLYVMIASTWKHRNMIKKLKAEQEIARLFHKEEYMKRIVKEYEADSLQKTFVKMNSVVYDTRASEEEEGEGQDQIISATEILKTFHASAHYVRLVGEAGIGKSRLMRHLEYLDAKKKEVIPVYVELKNLVNVNASPLKLLADRLEVPEEICEMILKNLKVHIFLDGVNEILCSDKEKFHICGKLDELAKEYPEADILISDRENSAVWISSEIPTFLLCKLDKNMQEQFIDLNCEAGTAEKVKQIIRENEKLGKTLTTPIMLLFLIETVQNGNYTEELDSGKAVSACYVKGLIEREVRKKGETRAKKIEYLLSALAISDAQSNGEISYYEEGKVLRTFKKCADEYGFAGIDMSEMVELVTQMGFLRAVKNGSRYMFSNKFLEDYFFEYALDKGMIDYE